MLPLPQKRQGYPRGSLIKARKKKINPRVARRHGEFSLYLEEQGYGNCESVYVDLGKLDTEKVPIEKRAAYRLIHERPEFSYEAFEKFYASLTEKAEDNDSKWHNVKPASVSVKCPRCGSTASRAS